jgi:Holliday junction resolvase-like predicted endonuclease
VCRFDVVGVDRDSKGEITIDWMRDAFRPGM